MENSTDKLYPLYYMAKDLAKQPEHEKLGTVLEDIGAWLSEWETWEERGSDPSERPSTQYRGKPTLANLNLELAFAGYKARGGKNPSIKKIA